MTNIKTYELSSPDIKQQIKVTQEKDEDNCLICRLMRIRHERSDIVRWIYSNNRSIEEKANLASLLTGINFDKEIIDCLNDPTIKKFLLSE